MFSYDHNEPLGYGAAVGRLRRFPRTPESISNYDVFVNFLPNGGQPLGISDLLRQSMLAPPDVSPLGRGN